MCGVYDALAGLVSPPAAENQHTIVTPHCPVSVPGQTPGVGREGRASAEVVPAGELVRLAAEREHDALALLASPDRREAEVVRDRREQLVVLAEAEILDRRALGERYAL